jgi:isocitrate lyase
MALTREQQIAALEKDWAENPRWKGVTRTSFFKNLGM